MTGQTAVTWTNLVLKVYQDALGVGSKEFTKQGEQDKCDKQSSIALHFFGFCCGRRRRGLEKGVKLHYII